MRTGPVTGVKIMSPSGEDLDQRVGPLPAVILPNMVRPVSQSTPVTSLPWVRHAACAGKTLSR